jgi:cytochrome oxidase assembly protein ShyY1
MKTKSEDMTLPRKISGMAQPSEHYPPHDRVKTAEQISWQVLDLAQQARAAGLTELCHLLESAALSAAADAEAGRWPRDGG